jgi:centromere protein I
MDRIELPNQLVAVLADPLLQKLLILRPNADSDQRIANWLNAVLEDVIQGDADQDTMWEVLEVLKQFVVQTKVTCYPKSLKHLHTDVLP